MSDLLPCPFCGNKDIRELSGSTWCICDQCGAEGPDKGGDRIANWNTRATTPTASELVEALREIAESDDVDNMLDPERNKRLARAALTEAGRSALKQEGET